MMNINRRIEIKINHSAHPWCSGRNYKKLVTTQGNHKGLPLQYSYQGNHKGLPLQYSYEDGRKYSSGNPLWLPDYVVGAISCGCPDYVGAIEHI